MMILTDDMDLAGDIIQAIMEDFNIEVREKHMKGFKEDKDCEGGSKTINNCPFFFRRTYLPWQSFPNIWRI